MSDDAPEAEPTAADEADAPAPEAVAESDTPTTEHSPTAGGSGEPAAGATIDRWVLLGASPELTAAITAIAPVPVATDAADAGPGALTIVSTRAGRAAVSRAAELRARDVSVTALVHAGGEALGVELATVGVDHVCTESDLRRLLVLAGDPDDTTPALVRAVVERDGPAAGPTPLPRLDVDPATRFPGLAALDAWFRDLRAEDAPTPLQAIGVHVRNLRDANLPQRVSGLLRRRFSLAWRQALPENAKVFAVSGHEYLVFWPGEEETVAPLVDRFHDDVAAYRPVGPLSVHAGVAVLDAASIGAPVTPAESEAADDADETTGGDGDDDTPAQSEPGPVDEHVVEAAFAAFVTDLLDAARVAARQDRRRVAVAETAAHARPDLDLEVYAAALDAVEVSHPAGPGHGHRVAATAVRIGEALHLTADELEVLRVAGRFHAIGLVGVEASSMRGMLGADPADLAPEVAAAPQRGADLLLAMAGPAVAAAVRAQNAPWEPDGDVARTGRVLAVARRYEDLVANGATPNQALDRLLTQAGTSLDPAIVGALSSVRARARIAA